MAIHFTEKIFMDSEKCVLQHNVAFNTYVM